MVGGLNPAAASRDGARRLFTQFSRATVGILAAVVLVVIGGLLWAANRSDDVSVQRQERIARHAIHVALDELALQQETVAIWDDSAQHMVAPVRDQQWLFDNVGFWLFRMFHHDESILLDERDRPVQVVRRGKLVPHDHFTGLRGDLEEIIASARGRSNEPNGVHDRNPSQPLAAGSTVRTTQRAVHDTHLSLVAGRPAAVSAMLMKPSTDGYVGNRREWPLLVSIRYLDEGFMRGLEATHLIGHPRFSLRDDRGAGEYSLLLRAESGEPLGFLIWSPELPGSRIMAVLLPANIAAVALLAIVMAMLMLRFRQSLRERGKLEEQASHLAYHDSLTQLPNRSLLNQRLQAALAGTTAPGLALLLIDLDRFKQVNDTLGHLAGDELIRQFAGRLVGVVRGADTVARLGGDEFAVMLTGKVSPAAAMQVCDSILAQFAEPFDLLGTNIHGSASIGAACALGERVSGTELMRRADVALYRSKADGRRCARLFEPSMDAATRRRAHLESEIREAAAAGQFTLWRQPQVDAEGVVRGQELLLRWNHPVLGTVSPDQVIPIAEETGLIVPIGDWVIDQAVAIAAHAPDGTFTALNLSPVQLRTKGFADRVIAACTRAGADPARIELEITEQTLLDEGQAIRSSLKRLRAAGFRIALDDFGTGYSSLNYLRRFTVDKLKIDRSFVAGVDASAEARAIVAAIVNLGKALGLTVAAEGVETASERDMLRLAGCDLFQGHHIAHPAPVTDAARFVA
jgi:diguanylate cyclase (GGDEF)-like protein